MNLAERKYQSSNRRVMKNTLFLYARQVLILCVSLYTSRVILDVLGIDDYGIYSLIGSFVALFGVISGAFVVAITRYMAFAMGERDEEKLTALYSTAMWMQIIMGGGIFLLILAVGSYYVASVMVLPAGRIGATLYVLFFSAVSFYISLLSVPYNALIVAHERMQAFAYIAVVEALLKLAVALSLPLLPFDKLIAYSVLIVAASAIIRLLYRHYCKTNFSECVFKRRIDWALLKDMMKFIQWAFWGNLAFLVRENGISMVINLFGGTTVNAARGIAQSVNNAVFSFTSNYIQAAQPQITKLFSAGQRVELCDFICRCCRYSFFLMFLLGLPLIKNVDFVLSLWLGIYPAFTAVFIIWTILDGMVNSIAQPLLYGTLAEGNIRAYQIMLTTLYVSGLPLSYGILSVGYSPVAVYILLFVLRIGVFSSLLQQSHRYGMDYRSFFRLVLARLFMVSSLAGGLSYLLDLSGIITVEFLRFMMETTLVFAISGIVILMIGMDGQERNVLWGFIKGHLKIESAGKG